MLRNSFHTYFALVLCYSVINILNGCLIYNLKDFFKLGGQQLGALAISSAQVALYHLWIVMISAFIWRRDSEFTSIFIENSNLFINSLSDCKVRALVLPIWYRNWLFPCLFFIRYESWNRIDKNHYSPWFGFIKTWLNWLGALLWVVGLAWSDCSQSKCPFLSNNLYAYNLIHTVLCYTMWCVREAHLFSG